MGLVACDNPSPDNSDKHEQAAASGRTSAAIASAQIAQIQSKALSQAEHQALQRQVPITGGLIEARLPAELEVLRASIKNRLAPSLFRIGASKNTLVLSTSTDNLFSKPGEIKPGYTTALTELAELLRQFPDTIIRIDVHSDNSMESSQSLEITESTASLVARQLENAGLNGERIAFSGWGDSQPLSSNAHILGRNNNRRIVLSISQS